MAPWLRTCTAFVEGRGSIPRTHIRVAYNHLELQLQEIQLSISELHWHRNSCAHTPTHNFKIIKINLKSISIELKFCMCLDLSFMS